MAESIWIVIVNYRTADLVVDCLRSVVKQIDGLPSLHTVVVDNASGDGSVEKLMGAIDREGWQDWASVHPSDRNGGFAFGNNAGIREALRSAGGADYVMLLNPDTIAHAGAIRALVDFLDSHQRVGIAGSLLENAAGSASVRHTMHRPHWGNWSPAPVWAYSAARCIVIQCRHHCGRRLTNATGFRVQA